MAAAAQLRPELLVIGSYWLAHQRLCAYLVGTDARLLWLNLVFLLCVAFLPFPTAVLGDHGDATAAVVLYAGAMSLTGFASAGIWAYASRGHRLVDPDLPRRTVRYPQLRGLVVPAAFLPSIAVGFASPQVAWLLWFVAFPLAAAARRWP